MIVLIVTGGKHSQLLVFWTWLGLEFDNSRDKKGFISVKILLLKGEGREVKDGGCRVKGGGEG